MTKIVEFPTQASCPADPTGTDPECIECAQKWAKASVEAIGWGEEINCRELIRQRIIQSILVLMAFGVGIIIGFWIGAIYA